MSFDTIDKLNREFEQNFNNGQIKEAVASYANDAQLFGEDKKTYQGLNQIEQFYSAAKANGTTKVNLNTGQVIQCSPGYLVETRFVFLFFQR